MLPFSEQLLCTHVSAHASNPPRVTFCPQANITTLGPLVLPFSEQLLFLANLVGRKAAKVLRLAKIKPYIPDFKLAFDHVCIHTGAYRSAHYQHASYGRCTVVHGFVNGVEEHSLHALSWIFHAVCWELLLGNSQGDHSRPIRHNPPDLAFRTPLAAARRRSRGDRRDREAAAPDAQALRAQPRHAVPVRQHLVLLHLVRNGAGYLVFACGMRM